MDSASSSSLYQNSSLVCSDDESRPQTEEDSQNPEVVICSFKPIYRLYNRRWFILLAYCMITLSALGQWLAFTTVSSILQKYYRVNMIAINWLSLIYELIFILFAIPFSFMAGKYGLGFTMVIAAFLNALGAVIRYFGGTHSNGFWFLFVGHTAGGLSITAFLFLPPLIAATWFGETERTMATGIAVAIDGLGMALGFFQSAAMIRNHEDVELIGNDLNQFLLSVAIQAVITFTFVCLVVRDRPPTPPSLSEANTAKQYGSLRATVIVHDNLAMEKSNTCELSSRKVDDEKSVVSIHHSSCEYNEEKKINLHENNAVTWNYESSPQTNSLTASIMEDDDKKILLKCNNDQASVMTILSFKNDILALMKNSGFKLILHIHAIAWTGDTIWHTLLNEMFILKFPGMELQIGFIGALSQVTVIMSTLVVVPILYKTQSFRKMTISIFTTMAILMVTFTIIFNCTTSFYWLSGLFCLISGLSATYFTIAFEHGAEITYPIPEGSFSVILIVIAIVYALIFANITSVILFKMGSNPVFVIMCLLYALGAILALPLQDKGPRSFLNEAKVN